MPQYLLFSHDLVIHLAARLFTLSSVSCSFYAKDEVGQVVTDILLTIGFLRSRTQTVAPLIGLRTPEGSS